jgi:sugar-specific transcriptional regulator TrmB
MEITDLEKLGLNKNEAKVYYALLKAGKSSAADLVKQLGIHRNIVYDNLEKIIAKGLASYIIEESKKVFISQEPTAILDFLDKKEEEIRKEKKLAKEMIEKIKKVQGDSSLGKEAEIYRGVKGMKKVLSEILKAKENLVLGMTNKSSELLGETYWKNYNTKIKADKIRERMLLNSDFNDVYSFEKNTRTEVRVLPKDFNQLTETILFEGKIAIFIYSDKPLAILIRDKALYDSYLIQFEFLWKLSRK